MPPWLTHLGPFGLFLVASIDSSVFPLPVPGTTDLLLLWFVAHRGNPWLLVSSAVAGSLLGGFTSWQIGHKGGEPALSRYVSPRILKRVVAWVERHPILSVFVPAILPPPIPLSPFVIASGALGASRGRFLAVFGSARTLRYTFIAWLGLKYGPRVIRMWSGTLETWSAPLLWGFCVLLAGSLAYVVWKVRGLRGRRRG